MGLFSGDGEHRDSEEYLNLSHLDVKVKKRAKTSITRVEDLTDPCYENLFSYLKGSDLKVCRFVCRKWKHFVDEELAAKTEIVFEGKTKISALLFSKLLFARKCKRYLEKSGTQFDLWASLRMTEICTNQIEDLISSKMFSEAVNHITTLELSRCTLSWTNVANILKCFERIENLKLIRNTYYYWSLPIEDLVLILGRDDLAAKLATHWPRFSKDGGKYCQYLKNVYIEEMPNFLISDDFVLERRGTVELLSILRKLRVKCEKLHLKIQLQEDLTSVNEQNLSWIKITKFLSFCSVKVFRLQVAETSEIYSFDRFLMLTAGLFALFPLLCIEELYLSFPFIIIENIFASEVSEFNTFISGLKNLKILEMDTFIFKGVSAQLYESIRPKQNLCRFFVGLFISDSDGLDAVKDAMFAINSSYFKNAVTKYEVFIYDDEEELTDLRQILPISYDAEGNYDFREIFSQVTKFQVRFEGEEVKPQFLSFNINLIVGLFPNLTKLLLTCGPSTNYGYYCLLINNIVPTAVINDYDLRLILHNLVKLKTLSIWANLEEITDFGITGRLYEISEDCTAGACFSNLKDLEKVSLRGVGQQITDRSAFHGFNDLLRLRHLEIIGNHKITTKGKKFLRNKSKSGHFRFHLSLVQLCRYTLT